jgi:hypothetical protein
VIEDDALFGWMRTMPRGAPPPQAKGPSTSERILAALTPAQAQTWRELTGPPVNGPLVPFGAPVPPPAPKSPP